MQELNKTQVKAVEKALKALLAAWDARDAAIAGEGQLAVELHELVGSAKIAIPGRGLEIAAIKRRTSPEGEEPVMHEHYIKVYGGKPSALTFDV